MRSPKASVLRTSRLPRLRTCSSQINLEVHKGHALALVGASGAGKSTLAALVPRFADPTEGSVRVDDVDGRGINFGREPSPLVSVVTQDTTRSCFSGSVRDNIAYARPEASQAELAAAQAAFCMEYLF